jgi:hypothetical protein
MNSDNRIQLQNSQKMIEHLEIALSYCELLFTCVPNKSSNALLADLEPSMIEDLIKSAEAQRDLIGAKWCSIECSVNPDNEF